MPFCGALALTQQPGMTRNGVTRGARTAGAPEQSGFNRCAVLKHHHKLLRVIILMDYVLARNSCTSDGCQPFEINK